jgi:hypothetical protein
MLSAPHTWAAIKVAQEYSLSLPQPIKVGGEAYCTNDEHFYCSEKYRIYLNGGYAIYPGSTFSFNIASIEGGVRYYPWNSMFYVGLGVGYRSINVSANISAFQIEGEVVATSATFSLQSPYFSPTAGVSIDVGKGISLGMDIGVQIAEFASGSVTLVNANNGTNSNNSTVLSVISDRAAGRVAGLIIPVVSLFKLTYYFY